MTQVHVLGVPLDHGAGRRGVSMGPSALRIARLHERLHRLGCDLVDHGDVEVSIPETLAVGDEKARYLPLIAEVCRHVSSRVAAVLSADGIPVVIGGDHSIAIGTVSGVHEHFAARDEGDPRERIGVLWFDAHGDINTPETSPSGNIHGMPVACLLGGGPDELNRIGGPGPKVDPAHLVQIGLRDIDDVEKELLRDSGVHTFTMADIDVRGMASVVEEAIALATDGDRFLHVSFDIDVLDPRIAPGTGTTKIGGITYREAHLAMEMVAESGRLGSLDLVEVNPILDEGNRTAELGVELMASALGKSIL